MPLIKLKNMKSLDFSCASPASTAICSSTDQNFMVKNSTKSLNRINSCINDHYKTFSNNISNNNNNNNNQPIFSPRAPCISELPFTPRLSSSFREKPRKKPPSIVKHSDLTPRRKSSADIEVRRRNSPLHSHSSRYLLGESKFLDSLSESHNNTKKDKDALAIVPSTPIYGEEINNNNSNKSFGAFLDAEKEKKALAVVNHNDKRVIKYEDGGQIQNQQKSMGYCRNDSLVLKKSSSSGARSRDQVVVLRVSLHCKGCEGKLRKHLSKMEGVTSFSIDLETKKVTVIGKVTPLGVLTSISKVKNAQFWPSAASVSPSSSSSSSTSSTVDFN
ncbi:Protein SODIUM POTASSIUM ROOT DEFECTIVE 1 [Bienertia sinuspersici]